MTTKHYAELHYPGIFFAKIAIVEVAERNIESVNIPNNVYAYRFFDRNEMIVCGEKLVGDTTNYSPMTYLGEEYSLEEIQEDFPECAASLVYKMEYSKCAKVVRTPQGEWYPLKEGEIVIKPKN